jgi:hypothetical protein
VSLDSAANLYHYDNQTFLPSVNTGPAPECRIGISPAAASDVDYFLNVLTATDTSVNAVPQGQVSIPAGHAKLVLGNDTLDFTLAQPGGYIVRGGRQEAFADTIIGGTIAVESRMPSAARGLLEIRPNPCNPVTHLHYRLAGRRHVRLAVYDIRGQWVETLAEAWQEAGSHDAVWKTKGRPTGLYLVRFDAGTNSAVVKAYILR